MANFFASLKNNKKRTISKDNFFLDGSSGTTSSTPNRRGLDLSKLGITPSIGRTAQTTPEFSGPGTVELAQGIAQGFARSVGAGVKGILQQPTGNVPLSERGRVLTQTQVNPDNFFKRLLFGTDKPFSLASEGRETAEFFGASEETAKRFGPLIGAAGFVLDVTPFGGPKNAVRALKAAKNADKAFDILRKMGVSDDIARQSASKFASLTDEAAIQKGLEQVQELQRTTQLRRGQLENRVSPDSRSKVSVPQSQGAQSLSKMPTLESQFRVDEGRIFQDVHPGQKRGHPSLLDESSRTPSLSRMDELPLVDDVTKLKDISTVSRSFKDIYRNFATVFGKNFERVRDAVLRPLDDAKGRFVDFQQKWLDDLNNKVVKGLGITRGSKLSALVQRYGEGGITLEELVKQVGRADAEKVVQADKFFRKAYDELLDNVNSVRAEIYPNRPDKLIPKRQNYYRHFREISGDITGLKNLFETPAGIDPRLAGISEFTKPKSKFLSFAQRRLGKETEVDAVGGFLNYLPSASFAIHIDPQIAKMRGFTKALKEATQESRNLNTFIGFLDRWTNAVAGKTNPLDRWLQEEILGRKVMRAVDAVNTRIKANVILGNLSSSIAQFFNIPQGIADAGVVNSVKGFARTLGSIFADNPAMIRSNFIKERYAKSAFDQFKTTWTKPLRRGSEEFKQFAAWFTRIGDEIGTKFIWNSEYSKFLAQTRNIDEAIKLADESTRRMVAGRGIGEVPILQQSRMFQVVAPFQLEVTNVWFVLQDFLKEPGGLSKAKKIVTFMIAAHLMNDVSERVRGSRVALDPLDAMRDAVVAFQEEEDKIKGGTKAGGRIAGEIFSNLPFGQTIAALLPEQGVGGVTRRELFGEEDPTRFGTGPAATPSGRAVQEILSGIVGLDVQKLRSGLLKVIPPAGGLQAEKVIRTLEAIQRGSTQTQAGNKRFDIEIDPENVIRGLAFGPFGFREEIANKELLQDLFEENLIEDRENRERREKAEDLADELQSLPQDELERRWAEIWQEDKLLAEKIADVAEERRLGLTLVEKQVKGLQVGNRKRALKIKEFLDALPTEEEKTQLWNDWARKKIITKDVAEQLYELYK